MKPSGRAISHATIVGALLLTALFCGYNLYQRNDYGFEVDRGLTVSSIVPGSSAEIAGVRKGMSLSSVGGQPVPNREVARWLLKGIYNSAPQHFVFAHNGASKEMVVAPRRTFNLTYVFLNIILGLIFLAVGLTVCWGSAPDATERSFVRLTTLTGISILLFSHENLLMPSVLRLGFSGAWLLVYSLLPAALVDFLFRFSHHSTSPEMKSQRNAWLYLPVAVLFALLFYAYIRARHGFDLIWITSYEKIFNLGLGSLLLAYFLAGVILMLWRFAHPISPADRDRMRWLLICTLGGLSPFFILYKAPTVLGYPPVIPDMAAFTFMLVVPIGWGMAVTSFRMFRIEWVLSRSIIYAIATCGVGYLVFIAVMAETSHLGRSDPISLILLISTGLLVGYLAIVGLTGLVRRLVDKIYYRDWFNYRHELSLLEEALSHATNEPIVTGLLLNRLPQILRVETALLILRDDLQIWRFLPPATPDDGSRLREMAGQLAAQMEENKLAAGREGRLYCEEMAAKGYHLAIPLMFGGEAIGFLLLGRKISGAPYSLRDQMLMGSLSRHAATTLANIALTNRLLDNEKRALAADMAGGIAHEINNALSPLLGQAQLIEIDAERNAAISDAVVLQRAGIIVDMCSRIKRIAQELGRLSEPPRLEVTLLSLNDVLKECVSLMTETAGRIKKYATDDNTAPYRLELRLDPQLPLIRGDRQQLAQLFINLIINAHDAMEPLGRGTLCIGTCLSPDNSGTVGYIQDTGVGIPQQQLDKVFQPYFTTKPKDKGTGLGLAIVRNIAEAHHGSVRMHSSEGQGTRIEIHIPILNENITRN